MKKKVPVVKGAKTMKRAPKGKSAGKSGNVKPSSKPVGIPAMKKGYAK
jgi:hypothetical protein